MPTDVIQPSAAAGKDSYIDAGAQTTNYGNDVALVTSGPASTRKILIQFDLSGIPSSAIITSAVLRLFAFSNPSTNSVTIHRGLVDWDEAEVTWQRQDAGGGIPWAGGNGGAAGTEYESTPTDTVTPGSTAPQSLDFDVLTDVQDIVNSAGNNYGWWLLQSTNSKNYYSSDWTTAGERPSLTVEYEFLDSEGTSAGTSTATGTLVGGGIMQGLAEGTSEAEGNLVSNFLSASAAGTSTATGHLVGAINIAGQADGEATSEGHLQGGFDLSGATAGSSTAEATGSFTGNLRGSAAGTSTVSGLMWAFAVRVVPIEVCDPLPLLYITDGTFQDNGQPALLNLIDTKNGFVVNEWLPNVAQYKDGGVFSDSPFASGRRLVRRVFANAIDVMEMKVRSHSPNLLIQFTRDLFRWQEQAADYWTSDYGRFPVYLVARAARESYARYAIIHTISVPQLANPYSQPFVMRDGRSAIESLTLRIERGDWWDTPPGEFECVPISSQRSWTVAGWIEGGA